VGIEWVGGRERGPAVPCSTAGALPPNLVVAGDKQWPEVRFLPTAAIIPCAFVVLRAN
jgi:hypothetical protein